MKGEKCKIENNIRQYKLLSLEWTQWAVQIFGLEWP